MMKVGILIMCVVVQVAVGTIGVPVLMWGTDGVTGRLPVPLAGHTLQSDAFRRDYLDSVMPCKGCDGHNVIVFLREKLGMEDLTQYGDVYNQNGHGGSFNNLKELMEKEDSLALASVGNVVEGLDYLKGQFGNNVHLLESVSEAEKIPFDKTSRLVLVKLKEDLSLPVEKRLAANDEVMGAVVKALQAKNVLYTAVFTAGQSSQNKQDENTLSGASSRHLLAAEAAKPIGINITDCFLMYYTEMALSSSEVNATSLEAGGTISISGEPKTDGSKCANGSAEIILEYPVTGQTFTKLTIKMEIKASPFKDWAVQNMSLSLDTEESKMDASDVYGPLTFSYACGEASFRNIRATKDQKDIFLYFRGFQVQAFQLDGGRFGYPNDCTPFFSVGILAGLIVSFLLIAIFSFGMIMVANITTMDRFDDPKGKQLTINVQEK